MIRLVCKVKPEMKTNAQPLPTLQSLSAPQQSKATVPQVENWEKTWEELERQLHEWKPQLQQHHPRLRNRGRMKQVFTILQTEDWNNEAS